MNSTRSGAAEFSESGGLPKRNDLESPIGWISLEWKSPRGTGMPASSLANNFPVGEIPLFRIAEKRNQTIFQ
jgi:hypothetical protein